MEIVEEQNPLQISSNPSLTQNKTTQLHSNSAGRPRKKFEVKFAPQPKSIISQLLQKRRTEWENKQIGRVEIKSIVETCDIPKINKDQESKKHSKSKGLKIYHCDHSSCTYSTTSSSNMIKHKRRHTSEKPYILCDQCPFRTNFINSLTVHKRIHTGELPFICEHCCYRCNSSSNLKKHHRQKHLEIT